MTTVVQPLLHPAAILRGRFGDEQQQVTYLKRTVRILKGEELLPQLEMTSPPPGTVLNPTLDTLDQFDAQLYTQVGSLGNAGAHSYQQWDCLSVDIESAGSYITLVGITQMNLQWQQIGSTLSLPFKLRGGVDYWRPQDHTVAVAYLYKWLADPSLAKLWHNGVGFDTGMLKEAGFEVQGRLLDTMVLAHYTYPEQRKGLQYLSTLYSGTSVWKHLTDVDDEEEDKA